MALCSLSYLKLFLGISADTEDERLQIYLDMASAEVKNYLKRDIESTSYPGAADDGFGDSGFYSGNGNRLLPLRQWPVTAVASVYYDPTGYFGDNPAGTFATATLLVYGTDYVVRWDSCLPGTTTQASKCGILERITTVWPSAIEYTPGRLTLQAIPARGNLKIAYTAGYSSVPYPIRNAVCSLAAVIRRTSDIGALVTSESLGGYSYSLAGAGASGAAPEFGTIRAMLSQFREQPI